MTKLNDKLSISICPFVFHYTCLGWMMTEDIQLLYLHIVSMIMSFSKCVARSISIFSIGLKDSLNLIMLMCVKMNEDK